jgi:ABC-type transport system involved in cytochrome c biogenesis permease subunit
MSAVTPDSFAKQSSQPKPLAEPSLVESLDWILSILGSQKIAVAMFAYGIFVVLVGTLAQVDKDIWQVVPEYFRAWIMWVDINLFFPPSFFPDRKPADVPLIPMPGGMFVGVTMIANMSFAHLRWLLQLRAKFLPLMGGIALLSFGWVVTLLVILNGHNHGGFQAKPPFSWEQYWTGLQLLFIATWVVGLFSYIWLVVQPAFQTTKWTPLRVVMLALFGTLLVSYSVFVWFMLFGIETPGGESLRILWQLMQATLVSIVLLAGCVVVFQKRGGVVLLHQGLLLLMLNELFVARYAVEYNISLVEGQTTNYLRDIRAAELALIDRSGKERDEHFVVPFQKLLNNAAKNEKLVKDGKPAVAIDDPEGILPVKVTVLEYVRNADLRALKKDEKTLATTGRGLKEAIKPARSATGTDSDTPVDLGAAYVKFTDKKTDKDLGTFLLAQLITEQDDPKQWETVDVSGKPYLAGLRFKRQYVPFTVQLKDVRKDDYVASNTPRNYSSDIVLKDPASGVDSAVHIKMNDPLRYSGLTLYQSGYQVLPGGVEHTSLAVVKNTGWMIPYVALMIIAVGMVAHFLSTLTRFLRRRENEELNAGEIINAEFAPPSPLESKPGKKERRVREFLPPMPRPASNRRSTLAAIGCAAAIFFIFVGMAWTKASRTTAKLDLDGFGRLPVAFAGRVMPIDTYARNVLLQLRQRETAKNADNVTVPATEWMLDLITGVEGAGKYRIIKIDNPDVLKVFELEDRPGHLFSTEELLPKIQEFEKQVQAARVLQKEKADLSPQQRKLLQLDGQLNQYMVLIRAFSPPRLPPLPKPGDNEAEVKQKIMEFKMAMMQSSEALEQAKPPLAIPMPDATNKGKTRWQSFHNAWLVWFLQTELQQQQGDAATDAFVNMLTTYRTQAEARDAVTKAKADKSSPATIKSLETTRLAAIDKFNEAVRRYESFVDRADPPEYNPEKLSLESWVNRFSPFYVGLQLYVVAFLLAALGWLIPSRALNWSSFTLVLLTFGLHTTALILRIVISGRPPVTNLYSSAIFIGWGCVLLGIVVEAIFRIGLGNLVATLSGFSTLIIAYFLGMGGDTIGVMQAVLDTQFWLATHVVCITLGYTATYVAGFLGVLFVALGMFTPRLDAASRKNLGRMIYGITCFAMFFSFFGTVLGGLWADDSWGRFWGWDPKENGALIIVLWNALLLHAKWDKMVGDRGLALLAIGGNIVTSWSWFGVNELGIGLHSYGFTEGVLLALGAFVVSQLVLIVAGMFPLSYWWSVNNERLGITHVPR